jgi:hypothetical protein
VQGLLRVGSQQDQGWTAKKITFVGGTCGSVHVTSLRPRHSNVQHANKSPPPPPPPPPIFSEEEPEEMKQDVTVTDV